MEQVRAISFKLGPAINHIPMKKTSLWQDKGGLEVYIFTNKRSCRTFGYGNWLEVLIG
jgi:hypothetical protein